MLGRDSKKFIKKLKMNENVTYKVEYFKSEIKNCQLKVAVIFVSREVVPVWQSVAQKN